MTMTAPCGRNCPDRFIRQDENGKTVTCHGMCERYRKYKEYAKELHQKKMACGEEAGYFFQSFERNRKRAGYYDTRK